MFLPVHPATRLARPFELRRAVLACTVKARTLAITALGAVLTRTIEARFIKTRLVELGPIEFRLVEFALAIARRTRRAATAIVAAFALLPRLVVAAVGAAFEVAITARAKTLARTAAIRRTPREFLVAERTIAITRRTRAERAITLRTVAARCVSTLLAIAIARLAVTERTVATWTITIVWTSISLAGVTGWIWERYIPNDGREMYVSEVVVDWLLPGDGVDLDVNLSEPIFQFIVGVIFLLTLPFVFRGLTLLHDVVARGLLGAWRSEALEVEVAQLSASRGAAVQAEDASLRRLERDIHDGPQQRLVRLQMDLATIERRLERDPESARALLGEARDQARETLDELRALSRGFAPPILQDRGLAVALESLAMRSPVPVTVEIEVTDAALPAPIERNAYFIAAELLTNAAKHSEASAIRLRVGTRDEGAAGHWIDVWVTDNGRGGATPRPGHGLAGLEERVRGLRGMLVVDSPVGGPTSIGAHVPFVPLASSGT
jgi:signal transduction histidine kinase